MTANCPHTAPPELPYVKWHMDAEERMKRGEKQRKCPVCHKWIWEEYYLTMKNDTK